MEVGHALLALGMLISGSMNTISTGWADRQESEGVMAVPTIWAKLKQEDGVVHLFDHPFFQAMGMFIGELLCMIVYLITRQTAQRDPNIEVPGGRTKGALWFAFPAMLDILGTGTMYAGLCLSSPSVFQMLRGASIVFTCILSVLFLKRTIHGFQWCSVVLVVIGILIVGFVSVTEGKAAKAEGGGTSGKAIVIFGDVLIILAQLATAIQMVLEEKLMDKYPTPSLKVVGLEGTFGVFILGLALIPMYYIRPDGYPLENTPDALHQMANNWRIPFAMIGNGLSIAFFNFFGISVTQQLSASHRMVLDSVRTLLVWTISLCIGWEQFHWLQLVGFFVLSLGTAGYNKVIRIPGFYYPPPEVAPLTDITPGVSLQEAREEGESWLHKVPSDLSLSMKAALIKAETGADTAPDHKPHSGSFIRT